MIWMSRRSARSFSRSSDSTLLPLKRISPDIGSMRHSAQATAFADQPERFASRDVKIHTVDRTDGSGLTPEHAGAEGRRLGQILDRKERLAHAGAASSARMQATLWLPSISAQLRLNANAVIDGKAAARCETTALAGRSISARPLRRSRACFCVRPQDQCAGSIGPGPACRDDGGSQRGGRDDFSAVHHGDALRDLAADEVD